MSSKVLVIAYGNPARKDDGLGPALADALEKLKLPNLTLTTNYQLNVEDALTVAEHDVAIFADAAVVGREPYSFSRLEPVKAITPGYTSHTLEPADVLALARMLFGASAVCYTLAIRGYEFDEFGEELSPRAANNLAAALSFLISALRQGVFGDATTEEKPNELKSK
ncbi:MAG: hydrogenase maturation protease [Kiritimatiellia bacterium]